MDTALRLSIWQPASFSQTYMDSESGRQIFPADFQQEIFCWDTGTHDLFGTLSTETSNRIRHALNPFFNATKAPSERSVLAFRRVVTGLLATLFASSSSRERENAIPATHWSDSPDVTITPEGEVPLRINTALGVLRHCLWIAEIFSSVPSASVLLR